MSIANPIYGKAKEGTRMKAVLKSLVFSLVCTTLSFFNGGVRYDYGDTHFAPIWIQLLRNYVIYFLIFLLALYAIRALRKIVNRSKRE